MLLPDTGTCVGRWLLSRPRRVIDSNALRVPAMDAVSSQCRRPLPQRYRMVTVVSARGVELPGHTQLSPRALGTILEPTTYLLEAMVRVRCVADEFAVLEVTTRHRRNRVRAPPPAAHGALDLAHRHLDGPDLTASTTTSTAAARGAAQRRHVGDPIQLAGRIRAGEEIELTLSSYPFALWQRCSAPRQTCPSAFCWQTPASRMSVRPSPPRPLVARFRATTVGFGRAFGRILILCDGEAGAALCDP